MTTQRGDPNGVVIQSEEQACALREGSARAQGYIIL